jgi:hypothetical protein
MGMDLGLRMRTEAPDREVLQRREMRLSVRAGIVLAPRRVWETKYSGKKDAGEGSRMELGAKS